MEARQLAGTYMNEQAIFGAVSVGCGILAFLVYWRSIYRGETKPHMFTHLVWAILASIGAAAQISDVAGPGAWVSISTAIGCIINAVWAYFSGEKNVTRGDWISLVISLSAIPLWLLTQNPLWSIYLISAIDFVAFYPTLRKSWHKPEQEDLSAWVLNAAKLACSIIAMEKISLVTTFYPASFLVLNIFFLGLLVIRRRVLVPGNGAK